MEYTDKCKKPLVSIIVITYNSEKYVLDTLNSIKAQTYSNIELIISDDCSIDNTVQLCKSWVDIYRSCFFNLKIIQSIQNTGIASNINRGYKAVSGDWIKAIAGDDKLLATCIEDNMNYIQNHPQVYVLFSRIQLLRNNKVLDDSISYLFFRLTRDEQYKSMLYANEIPNTPTLFIKTKVLQEVNYAEETFPFLEDYPLWIKLLKVNYELHFMDKLTVYYRIEDSITRNASCFINPLYLMSLEKFYKTTLFPEYTSDMFLYKCHMILYFLKMKYAIKWFGNKKTFYSRMLLCIFNFIDLYYYGELWRKCKKIICKE